MLIAVTYMLYFAPPTATCGTEQCSGRGECVTLNQLYAQVTSTRGEIQTFLPWEGNHTTSCVCDEGFFGPSCQYRTCPKGNDPMTLSDKYRTIILTIGAGSVEDGDFYLFSFNGDSFSLPTRGQLWTEAQCKAAFESMDSVSYVDCSKGIVDGAGVSPSGVQTTEYTVTFRKFPALPRSDSKSIFVNDGTVPLSSLSCDTGPTPATRTPYCAISDSLGSTANKLPGTDTLPF